VIDSGVFDVALALVLMFFILALTSSSIVEAIAGVLNIRGRKLEAAIKELVADPQKQLDVWGTSVFAALGSVTKRGRPRKPSYVSARAFADAVVEAIGTLKTSATTAADLENQLPANLKTRLDAITNEVGSDLKGMKAGLEQWFDEKMERVSGAYKRWSQVALFVVGLVLVVATNASTTRVAATTWNQSTISDAVARAARNVGANESTGTVTSDIEQVGDTIDELESLGLPVGWKNWDSHSGPIGTAGGWMISALLVMLGAPFWYGLLTRMVSLRASGGKPPPAGQDPASATTAVEAMDAPPSGAVTLTDALAQMPTVTPRRAAPSP
jgi:hypothetical protein